MSTPADENRARMPTVARWVDIFRATFPNVKVIYAREGDIEVGKRVKFSSSINTREHEHNE